ncbi:TIGR03899 family protein [Shewanella marina]|uniref:TIGR03899 family protein n=1 Tax=Shewanella marina TaxID=487319 RepID=UPI00046EC2EA|nr:TIGR03899 family protein [Shewanella marina]
MTAAVATKPSSTNANDTTEIKVNANNCARKKALSLGLNLGLVSTKEYQVSQASLVERRQQRLYQQHRKYQSNVETIYHIAIKNAATDELGEVPDGDWLHDYWQHAERVHQPQMQLLWAKLLAYQLSHSQHFQARNFSKLKQLTETDIIDLQLAFGLSCRLNNERYPKLIFNCINSGGLNHYFKGPSRYAINLTSHSFNNRQLLNLIDAQLLELNEFETQKLHEGRLTILDEHLNWRAKQGVIQFKYYRFTPLAEQLLPLFDNRVTKRYQQDIKALIASCTQLLA